MSPARLINQMNDYWSRLARLSEIQELTALLPKIDQLGLSDKMILKVGAMPPLRFKSLNQTGQINLYNKLKTALTEIQ